MKHLIDDAVKNALEQRNQGLDSEDALSDEEMKSVAGGIIISNILKFPISTTTGIVAYPYPNSEILLQPYEPENDPLHFTSDRIQWPESWEEEPNLAPSLVGSSN